MPRGTSHVAIIVRSQHSLSAGGFRPLRPRAQLFSIRCRSAENGGTALGSRDRTVLDSPIPSLFKERLFVYLSRFCEVRYCITRHCGFLVGLGHSSGDPSVQVETVAQALKLLKTPTPWQRDLDTVLQRLEAISTPIDWPEPETELEDCLFAVATVVFVEPQRSDRERAALRNAVGEQRFEHLMALLTFIRVAHYWTVVHPDLGFEDDVRQVLDQHEGLMRLLLEDPEGARCEMGVRLFNELELLRDENKRLELEKAKLALEERDRQRELLLRTAQAELAHVTRVSMMGELTASIAHEILQPLAGATTSANAARRWLAGDPPNLDEARACLKRIASDVKRAGEVIAGIRALVKKSALARAWLDLHSRSARHDQRRSRPPRGVGADRIGRRLAVGAG